MRGRAEAHFELEGMFVSYWGPVSRFAISYPTLNGEVL